MKERGARLARKRSALLLSFACCQLRLPIAHQPTNQTTLDFLHYLRVDMVYTSPTKKARIAVYKRQGMSNIAIGNRLKLDHTTIARIIKRLDNNPDFYHVMPKTGRPRALEEREVRIAARMLARTEAENAVEVQKKAFENVAARTLQRSLKNYGLICRVRRSKPYLSKMQKEARYRWAKAHKDWTVEDWKRVIFSDESKFNLFKSDGRQYAWFRPGQALDERFTKKTVKHGGGNVMVWGCITASGMGELHLIEGHMDGPMYVEILNENLPRTLRKHNMKFSGRYKAYFQQDNDPKHTSKVAKAWFEKKKVHLLSWPSNSPDMSIIEHVWDQLDTLVRARSPLPHNKKEMWQALQEEWANFPKQALDKLFQSMPRRIEALLKARGGHTKY